MAAPAENTGAVPAPFGAKREALGNSGASPSLCSVACGGLSRRTLCAAGEALAGQRTGVRAMLPFAGPAVIASVAYMDPGNLATNLEAGARYSYTLLWVVVAASIVAMLFQSLSARLGIVTGRNLAELSRHHFSRPVVWLMWAASEIAAMATDLAEFVGGAIGFALLLHVPMLAGMCITGAAVGFILAMQRRGFRPLELVIAAMVAMVGISYLAEMVVAPPSWRGVMFHSVMPQLGSAQAMTLAAGIVGATVMPHALYLHSSLTQNRVVPRNAAERRKLVRYSNREIAIALGAAALINMAMVAMAARAFHDGAHDGIADIMTAYRTLTPILGGGAAAFFMLALIASGLSSSAVGTMAGQVVMQGFVGFSIPLWVRRAVTMLPAFAVVAMGVDTTRALVMSQVALSLILPVPMISLVLLSSRREVMGAFANSRPIAVIAAAAAVLVLVLNAALLLHTAGIGAMHLH